MLKKKRAEMSIGFILGILHYFLWWKPTSLHIELKKEANVKRHKRSFKAKILYISKEENS